MLTLALHPYLLQLGPPSPTSDSLGSSELLFIFIASDVVTERDEDTTPVAIKVNWSIIVYCLFIVLRSYGIRHRVSAPPENVSGWR
jgi:hypothetical protein